MVRGIVLDFSFAFLLGGSSFLKANVFYETFACFSNEFLKIPYPPDTLLMCWFMILTHCMCVRFMILAGGVFFFFFHMVSPFGWFGFLVSFS